MTAVPGVHPDFNLSSFEARDQAWLRNLAQEWFLTNHGEKFTAGPNAEYRWFLAKPAGHVSNLTGIERETLFLISPYRKFEPRILSSFEKIAGRVSSNRIEDSFKVLISDASEARQQINDILRSQPEQPTIISIYRPNINPTNASIILWNEIRASYALRDPFSLDAPLNSDLFFFGRQKVINQVIRNFQDRKITGVFGVRRSGKTSIINGVQRALSKRKQHTIKVDCQDTAMFTQPWHKAFYFVCRQIRYAAGQLPKLPDFGEFTESNASIFFQEAVVDAYRHFQKNFFLIAFDEIERIGPETADEQMWRDGSNFIRFWRAIRASYLDLNTNKFGILITGTSPLVFELAKINGVDNPLKEGAETIYLQPFDASTTTEMVNVIGKSVGLKFDSNVCASIQIDAGGFPFLTRQICSKIHQSEKAQRPKTINLAVYRSVMEDFTGKSNSVVELMIGVIRDLYPQEFELLKALAAGDKQVYELYARDIPAAVWHVEGFGLVARDGDRCEIAINAVKNYLLSKENARKENPDLVEKIQEISARQNNLEMSLRKLIATNLIRVKKKSGASSIIADAVPSERREKVPADISSIWMNGFDGGLFFLDLKNVIARNWSDISFLFSEDKEKTLKKLEIINSFRIDAHAKNVDLLDFRLLRQCFDDLEKQIAEYI